MNAMNKFALFFLQILVYLWNDWWNWSHIRYCMTYTRELHLKCNIKIHCTLAHVFDYLLRINRSDFSHPENLRHPNDVGPQMYVKRYVNICMYKPTVPGTVRYGLGTANLFVTGIRPLIPQYSNIKINWLSSRLVRHSKYFCFSNNTQVLSLQVLVCFNGYRATNCNRINVNAWAN